MSRSRSGAESKERQRGTCSYRKVERSVWVANFMNVEAEEKDNRAYHAQSIEMPKRRKMPYSSHEKR